MNNILKVHGEDLINAEVNKASVASAGAVLAGSVMGALCVNVFAVTDLNVAAEITVTVKHADTENGSYADLMTIKVPAKTFKAGELAATALLPQDCKSYVTATAASATSNSGVARVTLGYLAR